MPGRYDKFGPRLPAEGGIAAKTRRGDIGDTWWSRRFVAVLESLGDANRLRRGRSYARSGQVLDLEVGPGLVSARVLGSRPRPYKVRIALATLAPETWAAVDDALAAKALFAASLLAGEMPREIEDVFREVHHPLFPEEPHEIETQCSCPDYANPCKHVAATYYILAERFDEDPFSILAWRGRARESLMEALRARRTAEAEPNPGGAPAALPEEPLSVEDFWTAAPEALALAFRPGREPPRTLLARTLGPLVHGGRDLAPRLAPALLAIAKGARKKAG